MTDGSTDNTGWVSNNPDALIQAHVTAPVFDKVAPPAPSLGNHGDCVSSATHAGVKGQALANIAKVVTNVGQYPSATCPAVN